MRVIFFSAFLLFLLTFASSCFFSLQCSGDPDCPDGQFCQVGGLCVLFAFCDQNSDCPSGQFCAPSNYCQYNQEENIP